MKSLSVVEVLPCPPTRYNLQQRLRGFMGGSLNEMFRVVSVGAIAWKNVETALSSVL